MAIIRLHIILAKEISVYDLRHQRQFFFLEGSYKLLQLSFLLPRFQSCKLNWLFFTFNVQTHHNFFCQFFQYHAQNMSIRAHQSCTKYIFERVYTCQKFDHPIFETLRAHFGLRVHNILTLLHSERPKLYRVLDILSAIGLKTDY